jgi:hypothetical protein
MDASKLDVFRRRRAVRAYVRNYILTYGRLPTYALVQKEVGGRKQVINEVMKSERRSFEKAMSVLARITSPRLSWYRRILLRIALWIARI